MNQKQWWHNIGSGIQPLKNDDMESHAERISEATWNAAVPAFLGIDLAKPFTERCVRVWLDDDGNLKIEEIPMSKIRKDIE